MKLEYIFVSLLLSVRVFAGPPEGDVTVQVNGPDERTLGAYKNHEGHPSRRYEVRLQNAHVTFGLPQWVDIDPSHAPKVLPLEGMIGMSRPVNANWYANGFLNILVGDEYVGTVPIKKVQATEQGERGAATFEWERSEGTWRATFILLPQKKYILCSVRYFPGEQRADWRLRLVCYPSKYTHEGKRTITTSERTVEQVQTVVLEPAREWWVVYYDEVYDYSDGNDGGAAAVYVPEDVRKAEVHVTEYPVTTWLEPADGVNEIRMLFWDGFFGKSNKQIVEFMKWHAGGQLRELRKTSFVNRAVRSDEPERVQKEIGHLLKKLGNPPERVEQANALNEKLVVLRERLREKPGEAKASDESDLVETIEAQQKLLWDLRWDELFSD